ncbi:MAG: hypothetical protein DRP59_13130 [Spirochaetes bacterium]|nr:MAG: hypothetical protein DRP59_13130 [Spirochaetota bacterium]
MLYRDRFRRYQNAHFPFETVLRCYYRYAGEDESLVYWITYELELYICNTFYDIDQLWQATALLEREGVPFRITDNSNFPNYRVLMSTFIKVDLFVREKDVQNAGKNFQTFL